MHHHIVEVPEVNVGQVVGKDLLNFGVVPLARTLIKETWSKGQKLIAEHTNGVVSFRLAAPPPSVSVTVPPRPTIRQTTRARQAAEQTAEGT